MFPFEKRFQWIARNRYQHLLAVMEQRPDSQDDAAKPVLEERAQGIRRWLRIRLIILVLLYMGLVSTAVSATMAILQGAPADPAVDQAAEGFASAVDIMAGVAGSLTTLFVAAMFLVNRTLGQLEVDILALLATRPAPPPSL